MGESNDRRLGMSVLRLLVSVASVAAFLAPSAMGQWSDQPATNLAISTLAATDEQPKIVATSDGGAYVSWFSSAGFDVRLQRLDPDGNEVWAHNGILIADRGYSSTQDYDLAVDSADNALLAFRDDRFAGDRITAQKIAPDGSMPWGAGGIQFDDGVAFVAAPKVAAATDDSVFVGWSHDNITLIEKLTPAGALAWVSATALPNSEPTHAMADLNASDNGSVIVSSIAYVSFPAAKHLYAQKVDSAGGAVWPGWVAVMDNDSLQFGNFPKFVSDGNGGGVFAWYTTSQLQCWAQHILANGSEKYTHNGLAVSADFNQRVEPAVSYDAANDRIYVFWRELRNNQSETGVFGQRLDTNGARAWGSAGTQVAAITSAVLSSIHTQADGAGAYVFYDHEVGLGNDQIRGARLDAAGNAVWTPSLLTVSSAVSSKSRLTTTAGPGDSVLLVWRDDRAVDGDIYAQNINLDGSLGVAACDGDADGDGDVDISDLGLLLSQFGQVGAGLDGDVDGDGDVDITDLGIMLANFGCG
jgi:hypothetical protein